MANPLMKVMLNNILVKEGKKSVDTTIQTENQNHIVNLKKDQESLLLTNVLHGRKSSTQGYNSTKERNMLTLEELRKTNLTNAPQASQDRPSVKEKPMVSLISIGKSNRT